MNSVSLPDDCAKQWDILLLLLSSEEKKIDRTNDSEVDTMNYFIHNEGVRKILTHWLKQMHTTYTKNTSESDTALKCNEVSLLWRHRGNEKFRSNNIEESYQCYCKSVVYAPQTGPMYPLALANRSAALLKMKRFKECLLDIKMAIESGYPVDQQHKLLLRRADCHIELCEREKAAEAINAASAYAQGLSLTQVQSAEFDRHIKQLEKKLITLKDTQNPDEQVVLPECYKGDNTAFVAASNAIELRRSETAGRYVATTEATKRGDVLFSEEPYAWVALPTEDPACEACCGPADNVVPCAQCSRAVYCSVACRDRAHAAFHRWECVGAQSELFPTIGIAHLALRVLLITAHEGFPRVPAPGAEPTTAAELFAGYAAVDNVQIYHRDTPAFYRMFNLVTNFEKMNNADYVQYALTATLLTLYLESYTTFLDELGARLPHRAPRPQLRLFAGALLLRALGQLVCNGHAALALLTCDDGDGSTVSEREVRRATAIYPSAAMMNHSCDPNIINTFHKSRLIIRCARELAGGAEVFNCYGPHRARDTAPRRRAALRAQYMFTCDCDECVDPARRDFVLLFSAYACQSCKGPVTALGRAPRCQQCGAEFRVERAQALLDRAKQLDAQAAQSSDVSSRRTLAQSALRLRQQAWYRHHAGLRSAADDLARLHVALGEYSKSVELIKQNIQSLEYQFGSFSAEIMTMYAVVRTVIDATTHTQAQLNQRPQYQPTIIWWKVAHEMRKLSDVMLERILQSPQSPDYREWCLETHKIIKKAVQLTELNYGPWEPLAARLRAQEAAAAAALAHSGAPDTASVHHTLHYNLKI